MRSIFIGLIIGGLLAVVMAAGCSSSSCPKGEVCTPAGVSSSGSGGGPTDGAIFMRFDDVATEATSTSLVADGTSGLPCSKDEDCVGESGAGVNRCSSDYEGTYTNVMVTEFATPVCIVPPPAGGGGNCDPGTDPNQIQFCDGDDPNDPSSAGVCVALNPTQPMTGQGICLPKCTFKTDGSPATGCVGHDACSFNTYIVDQNNNVTGIGVCESACRQNSDCSAFGSTYSCQVDIGDCTTKTMTRTKQPGDSCTSADTTSGACFCITGSSTTGFCTQDCIVGATGGCPVGWVCDTGEPIVLNFGAGGPTLPNLTTQTSGALGICLPACSNPEGGSPAPVTSDAATGEDGGTSEASVTVAATCPAGSTCTTGDIAGTDCIP